MSKQKLGFHTAEQSEKMDHGEEFLTELDVGLQTLDDDLRERIEYLRHALLDAVGHLTSRYWYNDASEEEVKDRINVCRFGWHYRNEIRLLMARHRGHDTSDIDDDFPLITDEVFGPRQSVH